MGIMLNMKIEAKAAKLNVESILKIKKIHIYSGIFIYLFAKVMVFTGKYVSASNNFSDNTTN